MIIDIMRSFVDEMDDIKMTALGYAAQLPFTIAEGLLQHGAQLNNY